MLAHRFKLWLQRTRTLQLLWYVVVVVASVSHPAFSQDVPAPGMAEGPQLHTQTQAADKGPSPITVRLQYTGEGAANVMGGLRNGGSYMNQILAQLHADTEKAFGWTGGHFVLEGFYENATSLDTQYVGAVQDPSLIDTSGVAVFRLYQAYYKQDIGNTNVLFGIYDPETDFGITRPMDIFFNGAYAWNAALDQSGVNGPSTYPSTSLGARVRHSFNDHWSVQAAVLDGVPDSAKRLKDTAVNINSTNGALILAEVDYTPTRTTKLLAGAWDYTGKFDALDQTNIDGTQRQRSGSSGGYIGGATRLYSQTARRGLDAFANIGVASSRTQLVDQSLNAGLSYTGLLDDRPYDRMGVAMGVIHAGAPYRNTQIADGNRVRSYEVNFEATYRAPVTRWLTVQPDIQYWINPGVDPRLKNDLLLMVHFEVSHLFGL